VQRDILARDVYKKRDGKKDVTAALCQQCLWARLGNRLLEQLGTFLLHKQFTRQCIYSLRSIS